MNKLEEHNYTGIHATIIADSKNEFGDRLTSFIVTFPRIVLAEFNTHRMLSRNSASSRAIPFNKMLDKVMSNPFIPIKWQRDHKGMQGIEYFIEEEEIQNNVLTWLNTRDYVVRQAKGLSNYYGVTKQLCNRLLEPFMWHTAIVTATEWENFFALRAHPAAEIHIADLAEKMLIEYNLSIPKVLEAGEWHIPFGDSFDEMKLHKLSSYIADYGGVHSSEIPDYLKEFQETKIKIATARCARISYFDFNGNDDYLADIKLHDRLADMGHWSPFEHCAKAMNVGEYDSSFHKGFEGDGPDFYTNGWSGNFRGFIQYRKTFNNENKNNNRVIKK